MSRVLLIGRGPLPSPTQRTTGFAQLRTQHFLDVLRAADHAVDLLLIEEDEAPGLLERGRQLARAADLVVAAGPHRPGAVAVAVCGDRPLWVDLPGDPLAELHALQQAPGAAVPPARIAAAQAAAIAALSRADHLSVISDRQRHAVLGQLGVLGRLSGKTPPIATIPIAYRFPIPAAAPRPLPAEGPVRLLLVGAVAPWLDDERLASALDLALARDPRLQVIATGGGVPGHYEAGAARLERWAQRSPNAARIDLRGWVPQTELEAILRTAHVGLCLDRPGFEPELGSRTRLLLYAWMGIPIAASPTCALAAELADADLLTPLPAGAPAETLAETILGLTSRPPTPERTARADRHLRERFAPANISGALTRFADAPFRTDPIVPPAARLAAEVESLRGQLADIHRSPTWRTLSRLHRLLRPGD